MKRLFFYYFLLTIIMSFPFMIVSCDEDNEEEVYKIPPVNSGVFVDQRDGEVYNWVEYDGLQWMTENFRYDINSYVDCRNYIDPQDWVDYADEQHSTHNRAKYGMYYSLDGARRACPEGWRIPTDEDWQRLEIALGMSKEEAARYDWRGKISSAMVSTKDNDAFINLLFGGYITYHGHSFLKNGCIYKGVWGFYWSDSIDKNKDGDFYFYRKFAYNRKEVFRHSIEPQNQLLSVRYVREATH